MEDLVGAGAVVSALRRLKPFQPDSDTPPIARRLFEASAGDLRAALTESRGGRNVIAAGLLADIEFAARLDVIDVVGFVEDETLSIKPLPKN
jgi:2-phosphosulfolactate phosphatase